MSNQNPLIQTTLVNSFINPESWVYVKLDEKYVRKKGKDLQEGDLVVVKNEFISKTLDDILPVLEQSERYSAANRTIHEFNSQGIAIPKLRTLLLRGLTKSAPSIEEKILREDADFSAEEYLDFTRALLQYDVSVGHGAVRNWLLGGTLSPENWDNFSKLASLNDQFRIIYESKGQEVGFHAAYSLFVGLRTTIMSYIAKRTGTGVASASAEPHRETNTLPGKYKDELELVLKQFMGAVDRERSTARITKITFPERSGLAKSSAPNSDGLSRAILTEHLDVPLTGVNVVIERYRVMSTAVTNSLVSYCRKKSKKIQTDEAYLLTGLLPAYAVAKLLKTKNKEIVLNANFEDIQTTLGKTFTFPQDFLDNEYAELLRCATDGRFDESFGTLAKTFLHLIELARQYGSATPKVYGDLSFAQAAQESAYIKLNQLKRERALRPQIKAAEVAHRQSVEKAKNLQKQLIATYPEMATVTGKAFLFESYGHDQIYSTGRAGSAMPSQAQLLEFKADAETHGTKFYTSGEIKAIFEDLGIPSAIKFINQDSFIQPLFKF